MAVLKLTAGTKEIVPVDVSDRSGATTDLSAASPTYTVLDDTSPTPVAWYEDEATTASVMRISCMIDTSATHPDGVWPVGHYRLFVGFTVGSEVVKLGPIDLY
jgi:hypothetical protein